MKLIKGNFSEKNKTPEKNHKVPIIYDEGGNYSVMLLDLIKPYMEANPTADELEEKVQLGMLAWNLSISKSLGVPDYNDILKSAVAEAGFDKEQVEVVKKISKDKQKKFPGHNNFVESYEMKEDTDNRMKVVVTCLPLMDMMKEGMDIDDEGFDDDDFDDNDLLENDQYEEGIIDRSAFSLNHKTAFIEWAKKTNNILNRTGSIIYMVDEKESEQEANGWLKKNFQKLMSDELAEVTEDKRKWPKLNYKVFCEFFEVQYHHIIWDTEEKPVKKY